MRAFTQAGSAKVEAQHRQPKARKCLGRVVDHFVMHRPAAKWVGMRHQSGIARVLATGIEQGLQPARRAAQLLNGLQMGPELAHQFSLFA